MKRLLLIPYAFVLMNWAAIRALFCFVHRRRLASLWVDTAAPSTSRPLRSEASG
jgi:hypothetical protein